MAETYIQQPPRILRASLALPFTVGARIEYIGRPPTAHQNSRSHPSWYTDHVITDINTNVYLGRAWGGEPGQVFAHVSCVERTRPAVRSGSWIWCGPKEWRVVGTTPLFSPGTRIDYLGAASTIYGTGATQVNPWFYENHVIIAVCGKREPDGSVYAFVRANHKSHPAMRTIEWHDVIKPIDWLPTIGHESKAPITYTTRAAGCTYNDA